jgi:serine/threonine-protein kinase
MLAPRPGKDPLLDDMTAAALQAAADEAGDEPALGPLPVLTDFAAAETPVVRVPAHGRPRQPQTAAASAAASAAARAQASAPASASASSAGSAPAAPAAAEAHARATVRWIGRYEVLQLMGSGSLGRVHEAWDPLLARKVAVRTLELPGSDGAGGPLDALLLHEARAAAGLNHPHIATVHDAGLTERGVYIATERLQGQSLQQALAAGWRPTPGQAALLVRQVAQALAHAHSRGVLHCDIRPGTLFITARDKPKLLDFGLAQVLRNTQPAACAVAPMPGKLAPEQLLGHPVDARTDIHALGVVFYELLTGRRPFDGPDAQAVRAAVLRHDPPLAHDRRPGVPATLAVIAARAMARDPSDRYATAAEMASDLHAWMGRHPGSDNPGDEGFAGDGFRPLPVRPAQPAKAPLLQQARLPLGLAAAGLLLLAAAAGAWQLGERSPAPAQVQASPVSSSPPDR